MDSSFNLRWGRSVGTITSLLGSQQRNKKGHHFWQPFRVQLTESRSNQSQLNAPPV
jgi:hypothetical protein